MPVLYGPPLKLSYLPGWDGRVPESREVRPLLALRDPEEHARRRRAWNRAFSTPALKDYEVLIDARISQLVDILTTKIASQKSVDLSRWLGWLTYVVLIRGIPTLTMVTGTT